mmetsp:Transcript_1893/g.3977  ORF Transcript_1893/g.3977 Transcript_1893/m.3977 type:complete len:164 (+) Transcript_1893:350-841(+)
MTSNYNTSQTHRVCITPHRLPSFCLCTLHLLKAVRGISLCFDKGTPIAFTTLPLLYQSLTIPPLPENNIPQRCNPSTNTTSLSKVYYKRNKSFSTTTYINQHCTVLCPAPYSLAHTLPHPQEASTNSSSSSCFEGGGDFDRAGALCCRPGPGDELLLPENSFN